MRHNYMVVGIAYLSIGIDIDMASLLSLSFVSRQSQSPPSSGVEKEARDRAGFLRETPKLTELQTSWLSSWFSSWWQNYQLWATDNFSDNYLVLPSRGYWGCCLPFLVNSSSSPATTHWGRSWTCWPSPTARSTSSCIAWCRHSSGLLSSPTSDPRPPGPGVAIFLSTAKPINRR